MLGPGDEAEDAAQEAALRAWRKREQASDPLLRQAWLRQITRREVWRLNAKRATQEEPLGDGPEVADVAHSSSLEALPETLTVRTALAELPRDDRLLLTLRYLGDMTQPEIARVLGMPEGTVKVRLHRIRMHLRQSLAGVGD
jgi:RNA polymerase sigma-70 factor (ECF subfamily)